VKHFMLENDYKSLHGLYEIISGDKKKIRRVTSVIHRFNRDIKDISMCGVDENLYRRMVTLIRKDYKNHVFNHIKVIDEIEKRWLYNYISAKCRRCWHGEIRCDSTGKWMNKKHMEEK